MMITFDRFTTELFTLALLICLIIATIVVYARKIFFCCFNKDNTDTVDNTSHNTTTDWKLIGHIKHLYIYPIEGGYRKEMNNVDCDHQGLTAFDYENNILWRDREYHINSDQQEIRDPEYVIRAINLHNAEFVSLNTDILKNVVLQKEVIKVMYPDALRTISYANDCGDEKSDILKSIYGSETTFRLGYQTTYSKACHTLYRRYSKKELLRVRRYDDDSLNPEFAMFSLVNDRSVEDVKLKSGHNELTHLNFRPNFVIDATKYCEDEIEFLKIGPVEFENVFPCTIDDYVNIDPETGAIPHNQQPYLALSEHRRLKDVRPDISSKSDKPAFGIVLDMFLPGNITVGDEVYAKFLKRP